jgi:hypothetical protein
VGEIGGWWKRNGAIFIVRNLFDVMYATSYSYSEFVEGSQGEISVVHVAFGFHDVYIVVK